MITANARTLALSAQAWLDILACRARLRLPRLLRGQPFMRREMTRALHPVPAARPLGGLLAAFDRALRAQPGTPGCLPRSVALRRFLARHGHAARLRLGLRRTDGGLQGHAWVEAEGAVVTPDVSFVRSFVPLRTGDGVPYFRRSCDV